MKVEIVSNGLGVGHVKIDGQTIPMVTSVRVFMCAGQKDIVELHVSGAFEMESQPQGINVYDERDSG